MASHIPLVIFKILTVLSGNGIVEGKQSICGDIHLVKEKGVIKSPNYPYTYPNSTDCTWTILSPPYSILTLVLKDVDIEDDLNCMTPPCCRNNVLILPALENELVYKICGHNMTAKPIQISQPETKISFHSTFSNSQSRGFLLYYFIEPFHAGLCPPDQTKCGSNSNHCFTSKSERCDGVLHCPNGEDEIGCGVVETSDGKKHRIDIKTSDNDKCVYQTFWCDGNNACKANNNQEGCLKNSVVSATIMGCLFCALLLVIAMMCGLRMYTMHSDNNGNYGIPFPSHIATRLSLTRYISLPELIDDDFFHREPPPSYSIAVAQPNVNPVVLSSYSGHRTRTWREPPLTQIKPPTPPPSTETSNQSSPSRDSITSSSYLSNDDNVQLVNTET